MQEKETIWKHLFVHRNDTLVRCDCLPIVQLLSTDSTKMTSKLARYKSRLQEYKIAKKICVRKW